MNIFDDTEDDRVDIERDTTDISDWDWKDHLENDWPDVDLDEED